MRAMGGLTEFPTKISKSLSNMRDKVGQKVGNVSESQRKHVAKRKKHEVPSSENTVQKQPDRETALQLPDHREPRL